MGPEMLDVATEALESSLEDIDPEGLPALLRSLDLDESAPTNTLPV